MRKLAREAVIFCLLGSVLGIIGTFIVMRKGDSAKARDAGLAAVHAIQGEIPPDATVQPIAPPPGFIPDIKQNFVKVPLTNGVVLFVEQCSDSDISAGLVSLNGDVDLAFQQAYKRGQEEKNHCRFFDDPYGELAKKYGGKLMAVPLGNSNQVEIEKDYWTAFRAAKRNSILESLMAASLTGFAFGAPGGFGVWCLYRLVRFAILG